MPSGPQIVFQGDSFPAGYLATHPPDYYITLPTFSGSSFTKTNVATSGDTLTNIKSTAATYIDPNYASNSACNILLNWDGVNDMASTGLNITGEDCYTVLVQFAIQQRKKGFRFLATTLVDSVDDALQTRKNVFNGLIQKYWTQFADGIVDLAADPRLGAPGAANNPNIFQAANHHLTDAGCAIAAAIQEIAIKDLVRNVAAGVNNPAIIPNQLRIAADGDAFQIYPQFNTSTASLFIGGNASARLQLSSAGGASAVEFSDKGDLYLKGDTTANRPTGVAGILRFNTTSNKGEMYDGTAWNNLW